MIAAFFVISSSWFARQVVIPRVASALGVTAEVGNVSVSMFRGIKVSSLTAVRDRDQSTLTCEDIIISAPLWKWFGGEKKIDSIELQGPHIETFVVRDSSEGSPSTERTQSDSSKPLPNFSIQTLQITNGSAIIRINHDDETDQIVSSEDFEIRLQGIQPNAKSTAAFKGTLALTNPTGDKRGSMSVKVDEAINVEFDESMLPVSASFAGTFDTTDASGYYVDLAGLTIDASGEISDELLRDCNVSFSRNGNSLGSISVNGSYNFSRKETRLRIESSPLSGDVINLFSKPFGIESAGSQIVVNTSLEIAQFGTFITLNQSLAGSDLSFFKDGVHISPFDLKADFVANYNRTEKTLLLRSLGVTANQGGAQILKVGLDRPMNLSFGIKKPGFRDASLLIDVTKLELANWQMLAGPWISAGILSSQSTLKARADGSELLFATKGQIEKLSGAIQTIQLNDNRLQFSASAALYDRRSLASEAYTYELSGGLGLIAAGEGGMSYDFNNRHFSLRNSNKAQLRAAAQVIGMPELQFEGGRMSSSLLYKNQGGKESLSGSLFLTDLNGSVFGTPLDNHRFTVENQLEREEGVLRIRQVALDLGRGTAGGGKLSLDGTYTPGTKQGSLRLRTIGLNENALDPLVSTASRRLPLASYVINSDTKIELRNASTALSGTYGLNRVKLTSGESIDLGLTVDVSSEGNTISLNNAGISWPRSEPQDNAPNQISLQGYFPILATSSNRNSQLTFRSVDCDLTRLIEFVDAYSVASSKLSAPSIPATSGKASKKSRPRSIPNASIDLDFGSITYRELAVTNVVTSLQITNNLLRLPGAEIGVNGAPASISGEVNLLSPSTAFKIDINGKSLPLLPTASSFGIDAGGAKDSTIDVLARIASEGQSTQNRLPVSGAIDITFRKARFATTNPKYDALIGPIVTLLRIPSVRDSSISDGSVQIQLDRGLAKVEELAVSGPLFSAKATGEFDVAEDWRSSPLDLPLQIALAPELASRINIKSQNAGTFVELPNFASISGTIDKPITRIDRSTGLLRLGLDVLADEIPEKNRKDYEIISDVLDIFDRSRKTKPNDPPPGEEINDPLELFRKALPF